jgi:hypothetical protein
MCDHAVWDRGCGWDKSFWASSEEGLEARLRSFDCVEFVFLFECELTCFTLARVMLLQEVWQPTHPHLDVLLTHRASYLTIADGQIIGDAALDSLRAR